ncbi:MAG TPA: DNA polymerase III subunit beta [Terriglobia bacterium]|nr:DNA polymerase III subunit beta [Terriglobia bacterium]
MQFTVSKTDLARELDLMQSAVERKATITVLSTVRMKAAEGKLEIRATDLEIALIASLPAKVKTEGALCVPAAKLTAIVKSLPDGEIAFSLKESHLTVKAGRAVFNLLTISDQNFPEIPALASVFATLPGSLLRSLIERTSFAISKEESRYTLNAALFELKGSTVRAITTDGHRLSVVESKAGDGDQGPGESETQTLFPSNCLSVLLRLIDSAPGNALVEMGQDDRHLLFTVAGRQLVARKISGQFPKWEAVLPKDNTVSVELDCKALTSALERVLLLADERTNAVRLNLGNGQLQVSCTSSELGDAEEEITVGDCPVFGEIGFNGRYLLDFLKTAGTENIRLSLKDDQSPAEFSPVFARTDDDARTLSQRYVVMPMRI